MKGTHTEAKHCANELKEQALTVLRHLLCVRSGQAPGVTIICVEHSPRKQNTTEHDMDRDHDKLRTYEGGENTGDANLKI